MIVAAGPLGYSSGIGREAVHGQRVAQADIGGRAGQPESGLARFEVRGLGADRALIRALARRLAEDGPEAARLRRTVAGVIEAEAPKSRKGGILAALRASPLVGNGIDLTKDPSSGARHRSVTRYLLDTNIVSAAVKPKPSTALLDWLFRQADKDLFIAALTIAEIRRGILEVPIGRRRAHLEAWFSRPTGPSTLFAGRILVFDERAGLVWAALMEDGKLRGRPRDALDMILAAISEVHGCTMVTDNDCDFAGLSSINPLRGA